jgi:hypothetical protein
MGCEFRRVGCHADCEAGKAQERENAAKKAYIRKHNYPDADEVLRAGMERRKKRYG